MTSKERFLTAMTGGRPDMVPVCPDISNMIPCRMTGRPFWDIYLHRNPPLTEAYAAAAAHFGFDAWSSGVPEPVYRRAPELDFRPRQVSPEKLVAEYEICTPRGDLKGETSFMRSDPPTQTGKPVKSLADDLPKLRWLVDNITGFTFRDFEKRKSLIGDNGIVGLEIHLPGLHVWGDYFRHEDAVYAMYDTPDLIEELRVLHHEFTMRLVDACIGARPDNLNIQSSGGITLQSPDIFRRLSLPTLQEVTRRAKEAGIPAMMHCCGKARALAAICAGETDLSCLNPLERPPFGDCELAVVKREHGAKLSLMGNLPTATLMLEGSPEDVRREARAAIDDAGEGGGFILSTGDQCGRDTPDENIFAMIREAREYGAY